MIMSDLLQIHKESAYITIDAREAIRQGYHPIPEILKVIEESPVSTLCEIHISHHPQELVAALEQLGLNVAVVEVQPRHFRVRVVKL
ncbi:amino acid decarboxylase [Alicyclobacillaceae bacterium I2511]|jgi:hypothetical protein|nr:amino acid decarboxylase [Alicyclobacillaceae bacterium I2511]